jgi:hypothetical protein
VSKFPTPNLLTPDIDFLLDTDSQPALSLFNTLKATTSKPTRQMPKRTFDTMANETMIQALARGMLTRRRVHCALLSRLASSQAVLAATLSHIAAIKALGEAYKAVKREHIRETCLLRYGEGITQAVPAIQAWMRGILTRRRVHYALLSADPDALAMAMWM